MIEPDKSQSIDTRNEPTSGPHPNEHQTSDVGNTNSRRKQILAVDDEADILSVVALGLEHEGFEVMTARHGRQALECVAQIRPDLIIMDVVMPEMSGLAALRRLKENPATENIPVIMLTARASEADVLSGWLRGADLYMTKPFDIWDLIANVHTIFRDLNQGDEDYLRSS